MKSNAATVQQYLSELPPDRQEVIRQVREVVLKHLPAGYVETMNWGMISYEIPLSVFPDTYNRQPLSYVALASQKNHFALYLMGVYGNPEAEALLREGFQQAGTKLDLGKSCLRFHKLDNLPLPVIGQIIAACPPDELIRRYQQARQK